MRCIYNSSFDIQWKKLSNAWIAACNVDFLNVCSNKIYTVCSPICNWLWALLPNWSTLEQLQDIAMKVMILYQRMIVFLSSFPFNVFLFFLFFSSLPHFHSGAFVSSVLSPFHKFTYSISSSPCFPTLFLFLSHSSSSSRLLRTWWPTAGLLKLAQ